MLKNKEKRDTFLLIFMAIIFILFLVYLFVPFGEGNGRKNKNQGKIDSDNTGDSRTINHGEEKQGYLPDLEKKITLELISLFNKSLESENALFNLDIKPLKQVITETGQSLPEDKEDRLFAEQLQKINHLSFYDLTEMAGYEYPEKVKKSLLFNIYLSLFLIKAKEEDIVSEVGELSDKVFEKVVNISSYDLISREIELDYQAIPVMFFFKLMLERYNLYPTEDDFKFFREKLGSLRDLSENKLVMKARDLINYSLTREKYRIEWTEKDSLVDPDDKRAYNNVGLRTIQFLKQIYLVFPDYDEINGNRWIKELISADTGGIELVALQISSEDPSKNRQIQKIFYMPKKSQFIVLLKGNNSQVAENYLEKIVYQKITDFHRNFLCVDFEKKFTDQKSFKKELHNFGKYLKKQVSVK